MGVMESVEEDLQREKDKRAIEAKVRRLNSGLEGDDPLYRKTYKPPRVHYGEGRSNKEHYFKEEIETGTEVEKSVDTLIAEYRTLRKSVASLESDIDSYDCDFGAPWSGPPDWVFKEVTRNRKKLNDVVKELEPHAKYDTSMYTLPSTIRGEFPNSRLQFDLDKTEVSLYGNYEIMQKYSSMWDYMQSLPASELERIGEEKKEVSEIKDKALGIAIGVGLSVLVPLLLAFPATVLPIAGTAILFLSLAAVTFVVIDKLVTG